MPIERRPPPFQRFFEDHRQVVLAFLVASVGPDEADDCFQETFVAALRAYGRLEDGRNLRAWILTIAQRKALDLHRGRRRRPSPTDAAPVATERDPDPATGDPDLWRAVGALPPGQRLAMAHRFVSDLPYREIGRLMGTSEAAARRSVHDGLENMRREWSK